MEMRAPQSFTLKANGQWDKIISDCWISAHGVTWDPGGVNSLILSPGVKRYRALWDTGASNTTISQLVVKECELTRAGTAEIHRREGIYPSECYRIDLGIPSNVLFQDLLVGRADVAWADVVIGMDIINLGDLAITNVGGNTVFSFRWPTKTTIDFTAEANAE